MDVSWLKACEVGYICDGDCDVEFTRSAPEVAYRMFIVTIS